MPEAGSSTATDERRFVVISADGHDGPPDHPEKLRDYLPAKHREAFDAWLGGGNVIFGDLFAREDRPYQRFFEEWAGMDEEWVGEAIERYWSAEPETLDPKKRLEVLEASGVAAELLMSSPPTMMGADDELARAVRDAHLRWEVDYCNALPGRLAGMVDANFDDLDSAIADIRRGREQGLFGGILAPARDTFFGTRQDVPGIGDPHWEPVWEVCEELDLPVITHGGGVPDMATAYPRDPITAFGMRGLESPYFAVRNLWLLMGAGVLDRHPTLKLAFIEQQVAFIPGLLHDYDQKVGNYSIQKFRHSLKMLPSEYWYRHGFVGASFLDPSSTAMRHDIGVENLMWGGDYPHPEGSWPTVTPALQYAFGGVPEPEQRAMLGGNAADVWDFDLDALQVVADRIGPTPADLASPLPYEQAPPYATGVAFSQAGDCPRG